MLTQAPQGTQDIFGQDAENWYIVEDMVKKVCRDFGISEIRTPVFEHTELFIKSTGETTDVVQKEMYTFNDRGNRSITLRPEGTPGVVRAYVERSLYGNAQPTKLYYLESFFRCEKPQAGRLRQFHQFGIEILGSYSPATDAEVISVGYEMLSRLGLKNIALQINSLGNAESRKHYDTAIKEFLGQNIDKLCTTCKERFGKNPLRILDCKEESCQKVLENAPSILNSLGDECRKHFEDLQRILTSFGIPFKVNDRIVRGLDYYTRTVFEFLSGDIGSQSAICGGGRYDGLIESMGGPKAGAIGFGMGIERVIMAMENQGLIKEKEPKRDIFVGYIGEEGFFKAHEIVNNLRRKNISAESDVLSRSVKAQLKYADKIGARYSLVIGDNEMADNKAIVKNMENGEKIEMSLDTLEKIFEVK